MNETEMRLTKKQAAFISELCRTPLEKTKLSENEKRLKGLKHALGWFERAIFNMNGLQNYISFYEMNPIFKKYREASKSKLIIPKYSGVIHI